MPQSAISSIKSSGIYTEVIDEQHYSVEQKTAERMLVGYSNVGPFNRPMYFETVEEFNRIYGPISNKEEREGSFFNRSCRAALLKSPIMCLNTKMFDATDVLEGCFYDDAANRRNIIQLRDQQAVTDIYDTSDFWKIVPRNFGEQSVQNYCTINGQEIYSNKPIPPVSIYQIFDKTKSDTYFLRGYEPEEYKNITIEQFFATAPQLSFMRGWIDRGYGTMPMSKLFCELYVFRGEFNQDIISAPALQRYFYTDPNNNICLYDRIQDSSGNWIDALSALSNEVSSNFINVYRGVLSPNFIDSRGDSLSLDVVFNRDHMVHGAMMYLDDNANDYPLPMTRWGSDAYGGFSTVLGDCIGNEDYGMPTFGTATYNNGVWVFSLPDLNVYRCPIPATEILSHTITSSSSTLVCTQTCITMLQDMLTQGNLVFSTGDLRKYNSDGTIQHTIIQDIRPESSGYFRVIINQPVWIESDSANITFLLTYSDDYRYGTYSGASYIRPVFLSGYTNHEPMSFSSNTDRYNFLKQYSLDAVTGGGVFRALTNEISCPFHYLVDTYDSIVPEASTDTLYIKNELAKVVRERKSTFGLLNFPSNKTLQPFMQSDGYSAAMMSRARISVVNMRADGADRLAYYTPFTWKDEVRRGAEKIIPSAAVVSNRFMDKVFVSRVFDVVAGYRKGGLSLYGMRRPEYTFSQVERDFLEPYGVNVLMYDKNHGVYVNSNRTSLIISEGLLVFANISELCIMIQDELEEMLMEYMFDYNNDTTRQRVYERATRILKRAKDNGAIYDFRVVCDRTNNTDEIVDGEYIVVDCYIEPSIAAGKMLQRIHLYRYNTIQSDNNVVHNYENYYE